MILPARSLWRGLQKRERAADRFVEFRPGFRQMRPSAIAVEERHAHFVLELADLSVDCRLGYSHPNSGAAEALEFGDGAEVLKLSEFHGKPASG